MFSPLPARQAASTWAPAQVPGASGNLAQLPTDSDLYAAPQEHLAVNAAEGRGQPWTILASMSTRRKARSTSSPRTARSSSPRIRTEDERFAARLGDRPRARILIEASTDSEWAARCLEALGHEVIVADPNFAPMYATRTRKVKTGRRDARALAEACLLGAYRPAHRLSDPQRHVRDRLGVRDPSSTRARAISRSSWPPAWPSYLSILAQTIRTVTRIMEFPPAQDLAAATAATPATPPARARARGSGRDRRERSGPRRGPR